MASEQRNDAGRQGQNERPAGENAGGLSELRAEIVRLAERIAALEARLGRLERKGEETG
jgi:hypothetical protein